MLFGYIATVTIELPILFSCLSRKHKRSQRITAGFLLTAFTYPIVILVLPGVFTLLEIDSRPIFLLCAETYAPLAEVLFFRFVVNQKLLARPDRDAFVIIVANLCSFVLGEAVLSHAIMDAVRSVGV
ncbi:MAG TPA: hypothetical protein EYG03_16665 [Planctomycetes bacterium]|nr:hypothetical protein [Fuerstiella sp.]HIK93583.1 hypothetical protein [Planctomycetota bacterium]